MLWVTRINSVTHRSIPPTFVSVSRIGASTSPSIGARMIRMEPPSVQNSSERDCRQFALALIVKATDPLNGSALPHEGLFIAGRPYSSNSGLADSSSGDLTDIPKALATPSP